MLSKIFKQFQFRSRDRRTRKTATSPEEVRKALKRMGVKLGEGMRIKVCSNGNKEVATVSGISIGVIVREEEGIEVRGEFIDTVRAYISGEEARIAFKDINPHSRGEYDPELSEGIMKVMDGALVIDIVYPRTVVGSFGIERLVNGREIGATQFDLRIIKKYEGTSILTTYDKPPKNERLAFSCGIGEGGYGARSANPESKMMNARMLVGGIFSTN